MYKIGMPVLLEFQNIKDNVDFALEHKFDFVELNMNFLYCYPNEKLREELLDMKSRTNLEFSFHYYDNVDISSPNLNYLQYLLNDMKMIGENLKSIIKKLVLHIEPGSFMTIFSEKHYVYKYDSNYVERTINNLNKISLILEKYDISIVLENVPIHPFMEDLYKELSKQNFCFTWDIGHDVIYDHYLFSNFRNKYGLCIKHMHMHNVIEKSDHQKLSIGNLQIKEYFKYVIKNDLTCVIEVKDKDNLADSKKFLDNLKLEVTKNNLHPHIITPK